ncbi:MAG: hypothetical protein IJS50_03655 [Desulfovibrio sp.]|nr:hypothetical protein [Desulfovibrio sp.]
MTRRASAPVLRWVALTGVLQAAGDSSCPTRPRVGEHVSSQNAASGDLRKCRW